MKKVFGFLALFLAVTTFVSCSKDEVVLSALKDISSFTVAIDGVTEDDVVYDVSGQSINISVPFGTDLSSVTPTIGLSPLATVSPASGTALSFTDGEAVAFTVTAEDGTTKVYNVTVSTRGEVGSGSQVAKVIFDETQLSGLLVTNTYEYNDAGFVSSYTATESFFGTDEVVVSTVNYDDKNQVTSVSRDNGKESKFTYENGMIVSQEDLVDGETRYTYVFTYDDNGYLSKSERTDVKESDETKAKYVRMFTVENGNTLKEVNGSQEYTATFDDKNNPFKGLFPMAYGKLLAGNGPLAVNVNNANDRTGADAGITLEYNDSDYPVSASYTVFGFATITSTYEYK